MRALLFDAVGTIIRPHPSVGAIYARAAAANGLRCRPALLEGNFHDAYRLLAKERFFGGARYRTSEARERRWWKRVVTLTFERTGCGRLPPGVVESAFEAFAHGDAWRPYAETGEVLKALSEQGFLLGVVSNFDSRLRQVLEDLSLLPFFSSLSISSECRMAKPAAVIFRRALEGLGTAPEETLHVGDRREEDYRGARRAGLQAILLKRGGRAAADDAEEETDVITTLRALPPRLRLLPHD